MTTAGSPRRAGAQFIYLDSNGDGVNSSEDVLSPEGVPTQVSVYLTTSLNPDESETYCSTGSEALTLNSYEFILHADGGTVAFGNYVNDRLSMGTTFGTQASDTDFYAGRAGGAVLDPGLYRLGTLAVTVTSGMPTINFATSTGLKAGYGTTFGTRCTGALQNNTYRLGLDWYGTAGLAPPGGENAMPASAVPSEAVIAIGTSVDLVGEFSDLNASDSLQLSIEGLPNGLRAVEGRQVEGRKQLRLYGILPEGAGSDSVYELKWTSSDGVAIQHSRTRVRPRVNHVSPDELEELVVKFAATRGMSKRRARGLGSAALPILARLLRSEEHRRLWPQITSAIGAVGDTAYFDTLRAFVWNRFQGPVDKRTFQAIHIAQASLAPIATVMPRAMEYLSETSIAAAWASVPWSVAGSSQATVAKVLARETLVALAYTDAERATEVIAERCDQIEASLPASPTTSTPESLYLSMFARELRSTHAKVRAHGFVQVWADQERRERSGR